MVKKEVKTLILLTVSSFILIFLISACGVKRGPSPAITTPNPFEVELNSKPSPSPSPKK